MAYSHRDRWQLIVLATLDWPAAQVAKVWRALKNGELMWRSLRFPSLALQQKFDLTQFQLNSIKKFFSEYTFDSFENWVFEQQFRVVTLLDRDYPTRLKDLAQPPPVLWSTGVWPSWAQTAAVIGSRHPSAYGIQVSEVVVQQLVALGCTIVSGCMFGADIIAQQQALATQGQAVGVLGYGLLKRYPVTLKNNIADFVSHGGGLISPFAPWAEPRPWRFLARNQIVAALADAVIVTEALPKSGTHSTVAMAAELGRVAAVLPSPLTSPFAPGVTVLLDQGALLLHSAEQLLSEVPAWKKLQITANVRKTTAETSQLLVVLQQVPKTLTELSNLVALTPSQLLMELTQLELQGKVKREGAVFRCL